ncbi:phosphotransferase [Streptomyces avermitilis]
MAAGTGVPDSFRISRSTAPALTSADGRAVRDTVTREAIEELRGVVDADAARAVRETALRAPVRAGPPVWIHADLQPGNVLVGRGRLGAVSDFGCLGLGDPTA